jgi:hypothetical protein
MSAFSILLYNQSGSYTLELADSQKIDIPFTITKLKSYIIGNGGSASSIIHTYCDSQSLNKHLIRITITPDATLNFFLWTFGDFDTSTRPVWDLTYYKLDGIYF